MHTIKAMDLSQGDRVLVRDRPVEVREAPHYHHGLTVVRYRSADIISGLMTCPPEHQLPVVKLARVPLSYSNVVRSLAMSNAGIAPLH